MSIHWLHVSDFHFKGGDPYDRDVVLRALVRSVREFRERRGRQPDLIFATGDVAYSGQESEYEPATKFFDALCAAAGVEKRRLFVIPGNHDANRTFGVGLARTLALREEADTYFRVAAPKPHISQKQRAFVEWHNRYFDGIRLFPEDSTCGSFEVVEVRGCKIGVLPLNSALFCQDDDDHAKLWVGRRCVDAAIEEIGQAAADLKIALIHHPLEWLHDVERTNIRAALQSGVDLVLRGHLHETDVENVVGVTGKALHMAAGAAYQTRQWPNRALYCKFDNGNIDVFPIRYEDNPRPLWTIDPSLFPDELEYTRSFPIPRLGKHASDLDVALIVQAPERPVVQPFLSNIPSRRNLPFVGRDDLLELISGKLGDPSREAVLVLHGPPGVGKSELAREFARRNRDAYPGGTFIVAAAKETIVVDLARLGQTVLCLDVSQGMPLEDQCSRTFTALGATPSLLIYDNVQSVDAVMPWLPRAGMPCHVLMTTTLDRWDAQWSAIEVPPLSREKSIELITELAGKELSDRYGDELATLAEGLPVQIVPASATLAYEARRGRLQSVALTLTEEAKKSFSGVYHQLELPAQLLCCAAARFDPQRIPRDELQICLTTAAGWSSGEFQRRLDACLDLHLLQDGAELRMHQLFASFVLALPMLSEQAALLEKIVAAQVSQMVSIAREVANHPNNAEASAKLMAFVPDLPRLDGQGAEISIEDGEAIGRALLETGQFAEARPFFERAVAAKEKGDVHGRVDHASLGMSVHLVGDCYSSLGQFAAARRFFERAVAEAEKGDVHGRVDHESLGASLHQVGYCYSRLGQFAEARPFFERAVAEAEKGDVHGRVDHASLGTSLHQVGYCYSRLGQFAEARPFFERAVAEAEKGDVHGRVDHASLGTSLHQVGYCYSRLGQFAEARPFFERAVAEAEKGDVHGRVDYASLGTSLLAGARCLKQLHAESEATAWEKRASEIKTRG